MTASFSQKFGKMSEEKGLCDCFPLTNFNLIRLLMGLFSLVSKRNCLLHHHSGDCILQLTSACNHATGHHQIPNKPCPLNAKIYAIDPPSLRRVFLSDFGFSTVDELASSEFCNNNSNQINITESFHRK